METSDHAHGALQLVVDLVNGLTPGERRGQPVAAPEGDLLRRAVAAALATRPNRARSWAGADDDEHATLRTLAERWHAAIDAAGASTDAAAAAVNGLLDEAPVSPRLVDHDREPWHLHAHGDDADPAAALAATAATALATLIADGATARVGTCAAAACDRVYLDTSRNGSRRYCSAACQARTKSAAYRARRSGADDQ